MKTGTLIGTVEHLHHTVEVRTNEDFLFIDVIYRGDCAGEDIPGFHLQLPRAGSGPFQKMQHLHFVDPPGKASTSK